MSFETIRYAVDGPVATITLHRPEKLNAFTHQMKDDVVAALDAADADDAVRAVVFTGEGKAYCAGADLSMGAETFNLMTQAKEKGELDDSDPRWRDSGGVMNLRIWNSLKPVIAAVNGAAVGVGATMLLPMDIRIAAENARFGFPFARRGIMWDGGASWFLPRIVGISTAMDWGLTGRTFDAAEAKQAGLVSAVLAPEDLLPAAYEKARLIAETAAPVSVTAMRRLAWRMLGAAHPMDAHRIETKAILHAGMSPDAMEGVMSFLEKRPPQFPMQVSKDLPPWWPGVVEPGYQDL
ncbi:MAG: enoyl-CoA hydratase/isomerase family protein [Maricaulaceae bacterium]|nr:enoyl-CoA hydratase/isomerase family protein [Maricaulaceae bacterium]